MSREIKILALLPYPLGTTPSQRYRIEQWQPFLRREGISLDFSPFADERLMRTLHRPGHLMAKAAAMAACLMRRAASVPTARNYDAVLIHRAACLVGPAVLERAIALLGRPVIFDFDDAIYLLHTTAANRHFGRLKFPGKTAAICRASAHVVVGNSYLADYGRRHNSHVTVIPPSVDTDRYRPVKKVASSDRIVVGWMGSSTSQTHLEAFAPVLSRLSRFPGVELRIVSDREPHLIEIPFAWRPWAADAEVGELAQFDIGIMPMPDDPWSHGKCAMKALLYMSMGVPTICSAVGANSDLIRHNENGLLAASPEDWLEAARMLISDPALRERLGRAGRKTVEQHYSMRHCARLFASVVYETLERKEAVGLRPSGEIINE
ncbi:MAG TPA: glycosyltransferase family 4 protein [Blastocatellia bacterium]|nr:glycosyltransferase family 4 protein [Blastocatellia bacterium]